MTLHRTLYLILLFVVTLGVARSQDASSRPEGAACDVELVNLDGSPLPNVIVFDPDYQCSGAQTRQFLLRNTGAAGQQATLRFQQRQAFSFSPTGTQTLPVGGSGVIVTISFNPGVAGTYDDTLVATIRDCATDLRIPMTGRRSMLGYSNSSVKFNGVSVGFPAKMTGRLINTSAEASFEVTDAFIRPAGGPFTITGKPLPATLGPGQEAQVEITYTPVTGRADTVELVFVMGSPCPREVVSKVTGFGIQSSIRVKDDTLDYGTKYPCEEGTMELEVENRGSGPLQINGLPIRGNDPGAFQQVAPLTFPLTLDAGRTLKVAYRFVPSRANHDGVNTAEVSVLTSDSAKPSVPVTLRANLSRQYLDVPVRFDLGRVAVGFFTEQNLVLTNGTGRSIHVDSVVTEEPFTLVGPALPADVPPGGSLTLRIRFTPVDSNRARVPLTVYYGGPCVDAAGVVLIGNGKLVPVGTATMMLPEITAAPGDRISVPILLDKSLQLRESESTTFRGVLRFNRRMLMPLGVRSRYESAAGAGTGQATSSFSTQGNDRVVSFQIRNTPVPVAPDTLGFIDMLVLAGDSTSARLHLDTLYWTDGDVVVTRQDGLFIPSVCSDRRVFGDGDFGVKYAAPNPFNPSTTISFETVESGPTTLSVIDIQDRTVATLIDRERLPVGPHQVTWDASGIPSGVYHVVMTSPARRSVYRILLLK